MKLRCAPSAPFAHCTFRERGKVTACPVAVAEENPRGTVTTLLLSYDSYAGHSRPTNTILIRRSFSFFLDIDAPRP